MQNQNSRSFEPSVSLPSKVKSSHSGSALPSRFTAYRPNGYYDIIVAVFCAALLISNIAAVKLIHVGSLIFDGGALMFPLTYIFGDVLSEIYGFKAAKRAIYTGFVLELAACLVFSAVIVLPAAPGWEGQAAYASILGFVPRIVLASLLGYLFGQLLNSIVLVKMRQRFGAKNMWTRLVGSTVVGEAADTIIFCTVAFFGVITGKEFLNYLATGYFYKVGVELIFLPLTYVVIKFLRRRETFDGLLSVQELTAVKTGVSTSKLKVPNV